MAQGVSFHVGLNRVDPDKYNGWDGALAGCENDARAMQEIADACGYSSTILLSDRATSMALIDAIGSAAQQLSTGDYFLLTYSGHGGQVDDANGDDDDGKDETWVLFDRMVVDDELNALWSQFGAGVRIFVLSDSCHSGTVAKKRTLGGSTERIKGIPAHVLKVIEQRDRAVYQTVQWVAGNSRGLPPEARIILISGCQDDQVSLDGDTNGLFTQQLLAVWNNGAFEGDYTSFHDAIRARMPPYQTPNLYAIGAEDLDFDSQTPFKIPQGPLVQPAGNGAPAHMLAVGALQCPVNGPASNDQPHPPAFDVVLNATSHCVFEIANAASRASTTAARHLVAPAHRAHSRQSQPPRASGPTDGRYRAIPATHKEATMNTQKEMTMDQEVRSSSGPGMGLQVTSLVGTDLTQIADLVAGSIEPTRGVPSSAIAGVAVPSLTSFVSVLDQLVQVNPGLQVDLQRLGARISRQYLVEREATVPSQDEFLSWISTARPSTRGGSVVRTFWWGFHVQLSHEDLQSFLLGAATVNTIATAIGGGIPSPAQPWFLLIGVFILGALAALKALDRGRGIYVSMSWFAPGAFVPTPV